MTHEQALAALKANTEALTAGEIPWSEWDTEVERVLLARYPSERARRRVLRGALDALDRATRTSSQPGTPHPGSSTPRADRPAREGAPDAP